MSYHMRPSRVLRKLRNGEIANCVKLNLADSRTAAIAGMCGFDCIWADMEHVPNDLQTIEAQINAAKIYDCDTMVRVSRGGYSDYIKPLELDAAGIMVPHIMSLQDAKDVVRMTRFQPIGRRPIDGGNADGMFCLIDGKEYIQAANRERFVVVQIEDYEPLDDLDAIADLEGIDMLLYGPADFSHSLNIYGQWDADIITETRKKIAKVCAKYGKFAGTVCSADTFHEYVDMGFQFLNIGADVIALTRYYEDILKKIK